MSIKKALIATSIVFFVATIPTYAQQTETQETPGDTDDTTKKSVKIPGSTIQFSIGKSRGVTYSDFYEESKSEKTLTLWYSRIDFVGADYNINVEADLNEGLANFGLSASGQGFGVGPVMVGVGFIANYLELNEKLFESKSLTVTGRTWRQSAVFALETGLGKFNKSHFRVGGLIGGVRIRDDSFFSVNGQTTNSANTIYNEDVVAVFGPAFKVAFVPTKIIRVEVGGHRLSSKYNLPGKSNFSSPRNKQGLIAERYSEIEGKIYIFPTKRVGVSARASMSKSPSETFSLNKYVSINMVVKLKAP